MSMRYMLTVFAIVSALFIAGCANEQVNQSSPDNQVHKAGPAQVQEQTGAMNGKLYDDLMTQGYDFIEKDQLDQAIGCYVKVLKDVSPHDKTANYNLACIYSLKKDTGKALQYLEMAVRYGWTDYEFAGKDKDFSSTSSEPKFAELLQIMKKASENTIDIE